MRSKAINPIEISRTARSQVMFEKEKNPMFARRQTQSLLSLFGQQV